VKNSSEIGTITLLSITAPASLLDELAPNYYSHPTLPNI
jgi:hypothetical protein